MLWFFIGVCAGVFADRVYPVPVSAIISGVRALWAKYATKAETPNSPGGDA